MSIKLLNLLDKPGPDKERSTIVRKPVNLVASFQSSIPECFSSQRRYRQNATENEAPALR